MKRERSDSRGTPERREGAAPARPRRSRAGLRRKAGTAAKRSRPAADTPRRGSRAGARKTAAAKGGAKKAAPKKAAAKKVAAKKTAGTKAAAKKAAPRKPAAAASKRAPARRTAGARGSAASVAAAAKATAPAPPTPSASPVVRKPAGGRGAAVRTPSPAKVVPPAPARPRTAGMRPPRTPSRVRKGAADLSDEERIESAKYVTGGDQPRRVFEEERFVFPETYARNRVRLLIKDPQWLFAHWDVDPAVFAGLRSELGERAAALSRLTLRVTDPDHGGGAVIHLPEDARSWYLRADRVRRSYRAELGVTLPSGEYRLLATSNVVRPPRGSASHHRASRRSAYVGPRRRVTGADASAEWTGLETGAIEDGGQGGGRGGPGPWRPTLAPRPGAGGLSGGADEETVLEKGGASDVNRPRAPGASDAFRR